MSDIEWKKKYEIGHRRIDFEHQIFVDLISKIDDAVKLKTNKDYLERLLNELHAYAVFHFISEENIMYSINYPDFEVHKQHHQELLDKYNQKMMRIDLGEEVIEDFLTFLMHWFVEHTLNEDKKIAEFVEGKNI